MNGLAADAAAVGDLDHGSGLGRYRWVVEQTFAWCTSSNPLRIRWGSRADTHQAFLKLACCLICW